MFTKIRHLKKPLTRLAVIFSVMVGTTLLSGTVQAAGETYYWNNDSKTSITVSKPDGSVSGVLNQIAGSPTRFSGQVAYTCSTTPSETTLTVNTTGTVDPTSADLAVAPGAECANFDSKIAITRGDGTTTADDVTGVITPSGECDQGSVSWIVCPLQDNISGAVTDIASKLIPPFLELKPVNAESTPDLYSVWQNMRDLANVLFIVIFMVIIFATLTQQDIAFFDQYTIKKIMPRLILVSILVQFSFLISGFLVDIGNILGAGVGSLLDATTVSQSSPSFANALGNLVGGAVIGALAVGGLLTVGAWVAVVPLLVSLLISVLVVLLVLGLRFVLVAILICISPIAMVAWLLPNTRKWATRWLELLFRLILMYPVIVAVISFAGIVSQILPGTSSVAENGVAGFATSIIQPLIVIAAFLIIPATFKLTGFGLTRAYALINGTAQRSRGKLKSSDLFQRGRDERQARKNNYMGRILDSKAVTSLNGGGALSRVAGGAVSTGAGFAFMGAPTSKATLNESNDKLKNKYRKSLDDMDEATVPNMQKVLTAFTEPDLGKRKEIRNEMHRNAPNLLSIADTEAGRAAIVRSLADKESISATTLQAFNGAQRGNNMFSVSNDVGREYVNLFSEAGKQFSAKPLILARHRTAEQNFEVKNAGGQQVYEQNEAGAIIVDSFGKPTAKIIERPVGSIDIKTAAGQVRKISASTFGDKHSADNFKVMSAGSEPNADVNVIRDAGDAALVYALHMDVKAIDKAFDPTNVRDFNSTPLETRLEWAKGVHANADTFKSYNSEILDTTSRYLGQDKALTDSLVQISGVSDPIVFQQMSQSKRVSVARDYIYGIPYDKNHDYDTDGSKFGA